MFSGLHLPIKLHKENIDYEIVRKPLLQALVNSRFNEDGKRKGPRSWRDDEYRTRDPARLRGRDAVLYATLEQALRAFCGPQPGDDAFDSDDDHDEHHHPNYNAIRHSYDDLRTVLLQEQWPLEPR